MPDSTRVRRPAGIARLPARARSALAVALIALGTVPLLFILWRTAVQQHELELALLRRESMTAAEQLWSASSELLTQGAQALLHPSQVGLAPRNSRPPNAPDEIYAAAARARECECVKLLWPMYAFRTDFSAAGTDVTGMQVSADHAAWIGSTATENVRKGKSPGDPVVAPTLDPFTGAIVVVAEVDVNGRTLAVGFGVDKSYVVHGILVPMRARTITRGSDADSVLTIDPVNVTLRDARGAPIFRAGDPVDSLYGVSLATEPQFGGWVLEASVTSSTAEQVLAGRVTRSPVPGLVMLLSLSLLPILAGGLVIWRVVELSRLRADFASSVSHELRTPLAQIMLYAEMMEMGRAETRQDRRQASRIITREARRLILLVENVLRFSRAEHGVESLSSGTVVLQPLLEDIVAGFAPLAEARSSTISLAVGPGVAVTGDADALRRIVLNLLDNAVKHGPEGQCIVLEAVRRGPMVRIGVSDEGPGIPFEDRRRVWEPFVRLGNDDTTGGGIGLAIVSDLATRQAGTTGMVDRSERGLTVYVELPAASRS